MKRRFLFLFIVLYLICLSIFGYYSIDYFAANSTYLTKKEKAVLEEVEKLTLVSDNAFPPLSFIDSKGAFSGYEADLVNALESYLGIKINYYQMTWSQALQALSSGDIDGITGMQLTEERSKTFGFTNPFLKSTCSVITLIEENFEDLLIKNEIKVAVQQDSAIYDTFREKYDSDKIEYYFVNRPEEAMKLLINDDVDIWIESTTVARYSILQKGLVDYLNLYPVPQSTGEIGFALNKEYEHLIPILNKALKAFNEDGLLNSLDKKWFGIVTPRDKASHIWLVIAGFVFLIITISFISIVWTGTLRRKVDQKTEQQRRLLNNIPIQIWYMNDEKTYGLVNKAHADFLGFSEKEIVGKKLSNLLVYPDEIELNRKNNRKVIKSRKSLSTEEWVHDSLGNVYILKITRTPKLDQQRNVEYIVCSAEDITSRKFAENALANEKERLSVTLASIGDGVITTDTHGKIVLLNKVAEDLTGWNLKWAKGRLLTNVFNIVDEKTGDKVDSPVERALLAGKIVEFTSDTLLISKTGEQIPIADSAAPIKDKEGKTIGVVLVFRDVTKEREAQEKLKHSEEFANSIINGLPDSIAVMDIDEKIIATNDNWEVAASNEEGICSLFKTDENCLSGCEGLPIETKEISLGLQQVMRGETEKFEYEYQLIVEHKQRWFYLKAIPMSAEFPSKVIITQTDITERKLAQEAVRESEEKYRTMFENTGTAMAILSEDLDLILTNAQTELLTGYSREYLQKNWAKIIHPEDLVLMKQYHQERLEDAEKPPHQYEFQLIHNDGHIVNTLITVNLVPSKKNSIASMIDITQIKNMESDLRESKNKIEKLHEIAIKMERCQQEEDVYQLIIEAAESILNFNFCTVDIVEDGYFIPKTTSSQVLAEGTKKYSIDEGIGGKTYRTGKSYLVNDVYKDKEAKPAHDSYRSAISAPLGDIGIFQVASTQVDAFNVEDVELTELLLSHAIEAIKRIRSEEKIQYMSLHDSLTGLYNRLFFEEELKRLDTERQLPLSLIVGDINGLKLVNDVFGHQKGDDFISLIARILKDNCRKEDIITRWGGDEFAILLPKADEAIANEVCSRIKKACNEVDSDTIKPSIALGVSSKKNINKNMNQVFKEAEHKMYRNKMDEGKISRSSIVTSLEKTLWEKSYETEDHARRLSKMSTLIAKRLKLTNNQIEQLKLLSSLHDIGKIAIPQSIIKKEGKLTSKDWEIIKSHPEIGYRIAHTSAEFGKIADLILTHHERWDGQGYPRNLKGEKIPIVARILAVVDAYDVMTQGRPYQKFRTKEDAIAELKRCAGSQFDPYIVEIFIELFADSEEI